MIVAWRELKVILSIGLQFLPYEEQTEHLSIMMSIVYEQRSLQFINVEEQLSVQNTRIWYRGTEVDEVLAYQGSCTTAYICSVASDDNNLSR